MGTGVRVSDWFRWTQHQYRHHLWLRYPIHTHPLLSIQYSVSIKSEGRAFLSVDEYVTRHNITISLSGKRSKGGRLRRHVCDPQGGEGERVCAVINRRGKAMKKVVDKAIKNYQVKHHTREEETNYE